MHTGPNLFFLRASLTLQENNNTLCSLGSLPACWPQPRAPPLLYNASMRVQCNIVLFSFPRNASCSSSCAGEPPWGVRNWARSGAGLPIALVQSCKMRFSWVLCTGYTIKFFLAPSAISSSDCMCCNHPQLSSTCELHSG